MAHRYRDGVITKTGGDSPLAVQGADLLHDYESAFERFEVHAAISRLMEFAKTCNTYIEMSAPWKLSKDPSRSEALDHVLFVLAESLRIVGVLLSPILPTASREVFYQLNVCEEREMRDASWGILPEKHRLGKPVPLFPRIEIVEGV
jgi:methionyl-tRNA synthetase